MVNSTARKQLTSCFDHPELASLLEFSTRLGCKPLLVQASNGNTSIKLDGIMWIKASGTWLEHAQQEKSFVPVNLERARNALRADAAFLQMAGTSPSPMPSIETAMHAALPHRVVAHVHSINTIAWAIRRDAPGRLAERLAGLRWQWIPYSASGIPLARKIEQSLYSDPATNVFVLANHGLVVGDEDIASVEALIAETESRLEIHPRVSPEPEDTLSTLVSRSTDWYLPNVCEIHSLATDEISRAALRGGVLYPCLAIILGPKIRMLPHSVPLSHFAEYSNVREGQRTFVILEDAGVILHKQLTAEQRATLVALARVLQRIDKSAPLRYLTSAEVNALVIEDQHAVQVTSESGSDTNFAHP